MHNFSEVSLLITVYNRTSSLERLLLAFNKLQVSFGEIVVSDDGSAVEHLYKLRMLSEIFKFNLIENDKNRGLGNNINKGQDAVTKPYTLYVQEDFIPTTIFSENFKHALDIFKEQPEFDLIRFYSYLKYPYLRPYKYGYSEMLIRPWYSDYHKIYFYSDHPHLRRSDFLTKFGRYKEGIKRDRTEYKMCLSVIQKKGKGLFYDKFKELFIQQNSEDEPSTMTRSNLTQSKNPFISLLRYVYRQFKYNYDILFTK